MKKRIEFYLKNNVFILTIYRILFSGILFLLGFFVKIEEKTILFSSFSGKAFNDSPKFLYDEMIIDDFFSSYKFVWAFRKEVINNIEVPYGEKVIIDTFQYFVMALKAKVWITSTNIERGLTFKKRSTIYINTWHGAGSKKIGNAVRNRNDYNMTNVNYFLTQSNFESNIFINDLNVKSSSLLKIGHPRTDLLYQYNATKNNLIKEKLNIFSDKKIILYAPTWRESENHGKTYDFNFQFDLSKWKKNFESYYIMLFRGHSFTTNINNIEFDSFFINVSDYQEMNDILLISDILITDYSTSIFDFSIMNKPFFIYATDYEEYNKSRGFYIDYFNDVPYPIISDEDKLILLIKEYSYDDWIIKFRYFKEKFNEYGGSATETLLKLLKKDLG